jgi:hypothetical protein
MTCPVSVDLDFNLLDLAKEDIVHEKVRKIILDYGTIEGLLN